MALKDFVRGLRLGLWAVYVMGLVNGIFWVYVTGEEDKFVRGLLWGGVLGIPISFGMLLRRPLELLFGAEDTRRAFVERLQQGEGEIQ